MAERAAGTLFDGVWIGAPARNALHAAGYQAVADLPDDLQLLRELHGVGPKAVRLLTEARNSASSATSNAPSSASTSQPSR